PPARAGVGRLSARRPCASSRRLLHQGNPRRRRDEQIDRLLHRESTAGAGLQSDDRAGGRHAAVDRLVPASWPGYLMYLVTGGSGFCGFEIVKLLSKNKQIV